MTDLTNAPTLPDEPTWFYDAKQRTLCCTSNDYKALSSIATTLRAQLEQARMEIERLQNEDRNDSLDSICRFLDDDKTLTWREVLAGFDRAERETARADACEAVVKLAVELCTAVDNEAEDIGGCRPSLDILAELGPAVDAAIAALTKS